MHVRIQEPALKTWKLVSSILNTLWSKLYLPTAVSLLALTYKPISTLSVNKERKMPRTRRRHHSRDRSSAAIRDKRRRVGSGEATPLASEAVSPPRSKYTRSAAKRRRHESDTSSKVSKEST
uniref:Uncharacterized protein n=1 Tax=Glossina pallidipes TaxID=7398 RepID=A0A1B0A8X7_GLOPL